MSKRYVKQWDLPCYPDKRPQKGRRLVVGLEKGDSFDKKFRGFSLWVGGSGVEKFEGVQSDAVERLRAAVQKRLNQRVKDIEAELEFAVNLAYEWQHSPEHFSVVPESE